MVPVETTRVITGVPGTVGASAGTDAADAGDDPWLLVATTLNE